jgi:hypothetical protein
MAVEGCCCKLRCSIDACIGAYCMYTDKRQASGPLADPVVSKPCSSDRPLVPLNTSKLLCAALGVQAVHRMQASQDSSSQYISTGQMAGYNLLGAPLWSQVQNPNWCWAS